MSTQAQFLETLFSKKKPVPDYSVKMIEYIRKVKDIADKIDDKELKKATSTPEIMVQLTTETKNYGEYVNAFISASANFKPIYSVPEKSECVDDFKKIAEEASDGKVTYDNYTQSFSFKRQVVMNDVYRDIQFDFGLFQFYLRMDRVEMHPIGNNSDKGGKYHPYILNGTGNKVCLGTFVEQYKAAMSSMRFHLAYSIAIQCVTNYGGDSMNGTSAGPQNPIMLWVGQVCSVCDNTVKTEEMSLCSKTNRSICPSCIDTGLCTDETDKEIYHPDLLKECKSCNKKAATVIKGRCLACRQKALNSV